MGVNQSGPEITSVSPDVGPLEGGVGTMISGSGFTDATGVQFDGVPATSFRVFSDTLIIAVPAAHSTDTVDVSVTGPSGTGTLFQAYTYEAIPAVAGISPVLGSTNGGTSVVITGTNLIGATAVKFGSTDPHNSQSRYL